MPSIQIDGKLVSAVFDCCSLRSAAPAALLDSYNVPANRLSPPLLTTVFTTSGPFTCTVAYATISGDVVVLGLDWFAFLREFYISNNIPPPNLIHFSLSASSVTGAYSFHCTASYPHDFIDVRTIVPPLLSLPNIINLKPDVIIHDLNDESSSSTAIPADVDIALESLCNPMSSMFALSTTNNRVLCRT